MNYRERMRKAVECPQFGNIDYGEWGALRLDQRKDIKRLLDEMDRADEYIKILYFKNENLQSKIDKANEYIEKSMNNPQPWHEYLFGDEDGKVENLDKLLNILREEKTDEETVQS